jgi:hypothetical protein
MADFDLDTASFTHDHTAIVNPTLSDCGRFVVSPKTYGFYVEYTGGGCTAWVKKFDNGYLVISDYDVSHNLGEAGSPMLMCFYDGSEDDMWGNNLACYDLKVGVLEEKENA